MTDRDDIARENPDTSQTAAEDASDETFDEPGTTDGDGMPVDNPSGG